MLLRLVLMFLSFKKCSKKSLIVNIKGRKETVSVSDARQKALSDIFAKALRIDECAEKTEGDNCKTLTRYLQTRKNLELFFEPLSEDNVPGPETLFHKSGELQPFTRSDLEALVLEVQEDARADVTFGKLLKADTLV